MATDTRIRQARTALLLAAEETDARETYEAAPSIETFNEWLTRAEILLGYIGYVKITDVHHADNIVNGVGE
jgi:hypothetical protein